MKIVREDVQGLPHLYVLPLSVNVVHQNVVRVLKIAACVKDKSSRNSAETFRIDPEDVLQSSDGIERNQHRRNGLNVIEALQLVGYADGHGRAAESHKQRGGGRLDHDIRADAFGALGIVLQQ